MAQHFLVKPYLNELDPEFFIWLCAKFHTLSISPLNGLVLFNKIHEFVSEKQLHGDEVEQLWRDPANYQTNANENSTSLEEVNTQLLNHLKHIS